MTGPHSRAHAATRGTARAPSQSRRRAVALQHLSPAGSLGRSTLDQGPGLLRPLIHRGGLRADIINDGHIATGNPITTE